MGISAALGAHRRALGALIGVIRPREITAGIEPARRNGKVATLTVGLGHARACEPRWRPMPSTVDTS